MFLQKIVNFIAEKEYNRVRILEKDIGYSLKFNALSPNWINSQMIFDMTGVWRNFGIDARGINYFTVGQIENNISTRFSPQSPYYQSWFGGYLVQFSENRQWSIDDHFSLAIADQKQWLSLYKDPQPFAKVMNESVKKLQSIKINGKTANLYQGIIQSHTDVGKRKRSLTFPIITHAFAHHLVRQNQSVKAEGKNFIPKWDKTSPIESFQQIDLEGYIAIIELGEFIKVVLYGNGAKFIDKYNKKHNTFQSIKKELLKQIREVKVVRV